MVIFSSRRPRRVHTPILKSSFNSIYILLPWKRPKATLMNKEGPQLQTGMFMETIPLVR
jgi:hypothetical protein